MTLRKKKNRVDKMEFECRITRSCIYWADDERDNTDFKIEAESLEKAKEQLRKEAMRLEIRSGASKLVQDVLIKINGEWVDAYSKVVT